MTRGVRLDRSVRRFGGLGMALLLMGSMPASCVLYSDARVFRTGNRCSGAERIKKPDTSGEDVGLKMSGNVADCDWRLLY